MGNQMVDSDTCIANSASVSYTILKAQHRGAELL